MKKLWIATVIVSAALLAACRPAQPEATAPVTAAPATSAAAQTAAATQAPTAAPVSEIVNAGIDDLVIGSLKYNSTVADVEAAPAAATSATPPCC